MSVAHTSRWATAARGNFGLNNQHWWLDVRGSLHSRVEPNIRREYHRYREPGPELQRSREPSQRKRSCRRDQKRAEENDDREIVREQKKALVYPRWKRSVWVACAACQTRFRQSVLMI